MREGVFSVEEVRMAFVMRALDIAVENNYLADVYIADKESH